MDYEYYDKEGAYVITGIGSCTDSVIRIPSTVEDVTVFCIAGEAFKKCYQITSVTIPASITVIGIDAFKDCTSLTSFTYLGTMAQWNAYSDLDLGIYRYVVHCLDGDIDLTGC